MVPAHFDELSNHPLNYPSFSCITAVDSQLAQQLCANSNKDYPDTNPKPALLGHTTASLSQNTNGSSNPNSRSASRSLRDSTPDADTPHSLTNTKKSHLLFYTEDHPQNRRGFRYSYCRTVDSSLPHVQYASIEVPPYSARGSFFDRSPAVALSKDAMTVSTLHGFSTARANVFVREGNWYYETKILHGNEGISALLDNFQTTTKIDTGTQDSDSAKEKERSSSPGSPIPHSVTSRESTPSVARNSKNPESAVPFGHVRVGLARREACLQAPVGFDGYGYGLRDSTGECIHLSRPTPFMNEPFHSGDVIGFHVYLPKIDSYLNDQRAKIKGENRITTNSYKTVSRDRIPIKYKGQMYFESLEYQTTKDMDQLVFTGGKRIKKKSKSTKDATENSDQDSDKESDDDNDEKSNLIDQNDQELIPGSFVDVYKNGIFMGRAFKNLKSFMPPCSKHGKNKDLPPPPQQSSSLQSRSQSYLNLKDSGMENGGEAEPSIPGLATSSTGETLLNGVPITLKQLSNLTNNQELLHRDQTDTLNSNGTLSTHLQNPQQPGQIFSPDDGKLGYYPCISVYKGGVAQFNFGPHFDALPKQIEKQMRYSKCCNLKNGDLARESDALSDKQGTGEEDWIIRPLCERYHEQIAEDVVYDLVDEVDFGVLDEIDKQMDN